MIKILFFSANPLNTNRLAIDEEIRDIDQKLQSTEFRNNFEISSHWAVRVSEIQGIFLRNRPNIVHFSGHGTSSSDIVLQDDAGTACIVKPEALSDLFSQFSGHITCVVLNACYSKNQAEAIAKHIDCVIGMADSISDQAAKSFSWAFYQALGYGKDVKSSFDLACNQLRLEGLNEYEIPKLISLNANPSKIYFATKPVEQSTPAVYSMPKVDMRQIRILLTKSIDNGVVDNTVLDSLIAGDKFIQRECELWDYKNELPNEEINTAETIIDIVSFHNTFGGYLIYGVGKNIDNTEFIPCGIVEHTLNLQQLRNSVENCIGEPIDITYREINIDIQGKRYLLGLLHVPKRSPLKETPMFFGKEGPKKEDGHPVYEKDAIYVRIFDQSIPAKKKEHYQLLFSERINEFTWDPETPHENSNIVLDHNLPNRNTICHKFFGRV